MTERNKLIADFCGLLYMVDKGFMSAGLAVDALVEIADLRDQIAYKEGQRDAMLGTDRYDAP